MAAALTTARADAQEVTEQHQASAQRLRQLRLLLDAVLTDSGITKGHLGLIASRCLTATAMRDPAEAIRAYERTTRLCTVLPQLPQ